MAVMRDETFGPIIPVAKVSGDEEAVRLMNDTTYGLTASVWTKDVEAGKELIERLDAGTVFINRADYPNPVSHSPAPLGAAGGLVCGEGINIAVIGPRLDGVENVGLGLHTRAPGLRLLLQAEELSCEGEPGVSLGSCGPERPEERIEMEN